MLLGDTCTRYLHVRFWRTFYRSQCAVLRNISMHPKRNRYHGRRLEHLLSWCAYCLYHRRRWNTSRVPQRASSQTLPRLCLYLLSLVCSLFDIQLMADVDSPMCTAFLSRLSISVQIRLVAARAKLTRWGQFWRDGTRSCSWSMLILEYITGLKCFSPSRRPCSAKWIVPVTSFLSWSDVVELRLCFRGKVVLRSPIWSTVPEPKDYLWLFDSVVL